MARSRSPRRRDYGRERDPYHDRRYDNYDMRYDKYDRRHDRYDRRDGRYDDRRVNQSFGRHGEYANGERGGREDTRERESADRSRSSQDHLKTKEARSAVQSKSQTMHSATSELSREEKLKARQAKLQEWKLKTERLKRKESATSVTSGTSEGSAENGEIQIHIAENVRTVSNGSTAAANANGKVKPVSLGWSLGKKDPRNAIGPVLDDEESVRKLPKLSFLNDDVDVEMKDDTTNEISNGRTHQEEDDDPLDMFMASLGESNGNAVELPSLVMDQDEADGSNGNDGDQNPERLMAELEKRKKKEIAVVDHSKIDYEPFRKTFYVEPPELHDMTDLEVDQLRLELDGIKVRGAKCPKPVTRWSQFGLSTSSMEIINSLGYEKPTSIQSQAIPAIMSGRDVIGVAKTGSGKTMAFLLPLFRHVKDQRPLAATDGPISLIMSPTRELAIQIYRECKPFLKALDLRAVCAYGGSPIKDQIADLKRRAEIIVCTPGRMIDLLAANSGRVTNLTRVTYLVLDEADRMFDMGFEPQVMKIIQNIRPDRQTVLFSATFPRVMEGLARKILHKPVEIVVGARSVVASEVTQIVEVREEKSKFLRTLELLGDFYSKNEDARALIFVDRQESADNLFKDLMERGYPCMSIHGGKDQIDRDSTISDFKQGIVTLLVATSIAARGLDVKQLKLVINYDAPNHMEDYVHRVGRTGRAGNTGTAVTFITPEQDRSAMDIAKALKLSKVDVPEPVQKLADVFLSKFKSGKEKWGSGFGGNGLEKLDEQRLSARKDERKAYGAEEVEAKADVYESDDDSMELTSSRVESPGLAAPTFPTIAPVVVTNKGGSGPKVVAGSAPDNHGPDAGQFWATLEINDFPLESRRFLTNLSTISKVIEAHSVSITNKGEFYPPGKVPTRSGPRKLYLLIEGQSEASVVNAHKQLVSILMSGIEQAASSLDRTTRYTVA